MEKGYGGSKLSFGTVSAQALKEERKCAGDVWNLLVFEKGSWSAGEKIDCQF